MNRCLSLAALLTLSVASATSVAHAAPSHATKPKLSIVSPQNGATLTTQTVRIHVSVSNWTPGSDGHINYALDSLSNFVAARDATVALSHGWSVVPPGRHTVIVYLANKQNQPIPNAMRAMVSFRVVRSGGTGARVLGVTTMPRTGGGAGGPSPTPLLELLFAGLAALAVGIGLTRRHA